ncbi:MAG TPA: hypothetical protein DCL39_12855 [Alteromonas macleodii]|nr:hypothetical protein [Alteromonas macleodii]|tara:strand:+ start:658 stop:846 length:189 start_codon:yes stop_codon:yes gene_type:complete
MIYSNDFTRAQINAVIDEVGEETFIKHVLSGDFSDATKVAMQLSYDQDGVLTKQDKDIIATL